MKIINNVVIRGSNEPIFLKNINLNSLRVVEIQEAVNLSVLNSIYNTFQIDLSELDIIKSEADVLLFKNFTSNDEDLTETLSLLSDLNICVFTANFDLENISTDFLKNNCLIGGFIQYKLPEPYVNILGVEYFSEAILSQVNTFGGTINDPISTVKAVFNFII